MNNNKRIVAHRRAQRALSDSFYLDIILWACIIYRARNNERDFGVINDQHGPSHARSRHRIGQYYLSKIEKERRREGEYLNYSALRDKAPPPVIKRT